MTEKDQDSHGNSRTWPRLKRSGDDDSASRFSPVVKTLALGLLVGLIATLAYSIGAAEANWESLSVSAMIALAAAAAGGFFGLLFGVPRTLQAEPGSASVGAQERSFAIGANTNLEQISDWLTKIIVGVTLTQLGSIKNGASELFSSMAQVFDGAAGASTFVGSIVIYFSILGFFGGWLYARLRLGAAMSAADAYLELSRRAQSAGDPKTAAAAQVVAANIVSTGAPPTTDPVSGKQKHVE